MFKDNPTAATSISVFIPTASRPNLLRTALQSVAAQTALSKVIEVVVIENLGNRESEKVCHEFPHLPIQYVFRDPPLPPGYRWFHDALTYINGDLVAILFDDDWWIDDHLQKAQVALNQNLNSVASYAPWITTPGKDQYLRGVVGSFIPYFAASKPPVNYLMTLDLADLLVASQISTSFHMSSLVAKRDVLTKSIECFADGNNYDIDRLISVEFGKYGEVIYDQRPHVYVLEHEGSEGRRLTLNKEGNKWWIKSNESLLLLAQKEGVNIKSEFEDRMKSKKIDLEELSRHFFVGQFEYLIKKSILRTSVPMPKLFYLTRRIARKLLYANYYGN